MTEQNIRLTSAEIASLWTVYMNDSMQACLLGYFLKDIVDEDTRKITEEVHEQTISNLEKMRHIYRSEHLPIPIGFSKKDINLNAPRLYTDDFMLEYVGHLASTALVVFSGCIAMAARKDLRQFFREGLVKASNIYENYMEVALKKGLYVRAPYIAYPTTVDMIDDEKYVGGLNPFSSKRPLNTLEISYLYMNLKTNVLGSKLALSFAQASPTEKVQKWLMRGNEISKNHITKFTEILLQEDVQVPQSADVCITDSTVAPFSDKLMMFLMTQLCALGVGNYATSASVSQRKDLALNYEKLSLEIGRFAKAGADIMIEQQWMEQPPGTVDKHKLVKNKHQ